MFSECQSGFSRVEKAISSVAKPVVTCKGSGNWTDLVLTKCFGALQMNINQCVHREKSFHV